MRTFLIALFCVAAGSWCCQAQTTTNEINSIRREIEELRQDYQQRMNALEHRLHKLESGAAVAPPEPLAQPEVPITNAAVPAASSTAPTNAENAGLRFAHQQFQYDTESRQRALMAEPGPLSQRVEQVLNDFVEMSGYFRAGYGRNDQGGTQTSFQAPGAFSKYRLGNEAENYGELAFGKNFYVPDLFSIEPRERPDGTPTGPIARVQTRLSIYNPYEDVLTTSSTEFDLPEAWAEIGNVVAAQPSLKFWAGKRFYRRHDIHISDFFFYNMSGAGGGAEDFALPFGKVALAWIGAGAQSGFSDIPQPDPNNLAGFSKANLDLRLYDVPVPLGTGEFGVVFARTGSGEDALGNSAPGSEGVAGTFLHTRDRFLAVDGVNKFSVQFGTGPAKTFTSGFETFTTANGLYIRPDARDSWRFRVTEHFTANLNDHFSLGPAFVYQWTDYGSQGDQEHWVSAGLRPIIHFNRHLSLASEAGVDWVESHEAGTSSYLGKVTLAPQVSLGGRFMSRPVIRAFITYAWWGDDFSGQVGGLDYIGETQGLTYGVQMEAWW